MKLYLKYCGGCNPLFDRGVVARRLRQDFPRLELTREPSEAALVAVICGCSRACADVPAEYAGAVYVCAESDYTLLKERVAAMEA